MAHNHIAVGALLLLALLGCNPFYSVQQSDVERGYRWIRRGEIENATTTFERAVGSYPQSVLAHTGLADAFFAAHKYGRAIATYSQAISLLRKDEPISKKGPSGDEEIVGMRAFSYQNQGLKFPHGLEAYLYLQRGSALDQLALCEPDRSSEFAPRAMADYDSAIALSPSYAEAISKRNALLRRQEKANQNTGQ